MVLSKKNRTLRQVLDRAKVEHLIYLCIECSYYCNSDNDIDSFFLSTAEEMKEYLIDVSFYQDADFVFDCIFNYPLNTEVSFIEQESQEEGIVIYHNFMGKTLGIKDCFGKTQEIEVDYVWGLDSYVE